MLNHVSVRSTVLLDSLAALEWEDLLIGREELRSFRIVNDASWDIEIAVVQGCLTAESAARQFELSCFGLSDGNANQMTTHLSRMATLQRTTGQWPTTLIAVGETRQGPFTLLDGNHRAVVMLVDPAPTAEMKSVETDNTGRTVEVPRDLRLLVGIGRDVRLWPFWRNCSHET